MTSDAVSVTVNCPNCHGPIVWRRAARDDGKRALAIVHWPCRCLLTAQEWGDLAATAAMVAEDALPAKCQGEMAEGIRWVPRLCWTGAESE